MPEQHCIMGHQAVPTAQTALWSGMLGSQGCSMASMTGNIACVWERQKEQQGSSHTSIRVALYRKMLAFCNRPIRSARLPICSTLSSPAEGEVWAPIAKAGVKCTSPCHRRLADLSGSIRAVDTIAS